MSARCDGQDDDVDMASADPKLDEANSCPGDGNKNSAGLDKDETVRRGNFDLMEAEEEEGEDGKFKKAVKAPVMCEDVAGKNSTLESKSATEMEATPSKVEETEATVVTETQATVDHTDEGAFVSTLVKCGMQYSADSTIFACGNINWTLLKLQRVMNSSEALQEEFLEQFEEFALRGHGVGLRSLLQPLQKSLNQVVAPGVVTKRDSVMKVVLHVHSIQRRVIDLLLEWVSSQAAGEDSEADFNDNLPRLLLHQLRFLNFVVDGEAMANSLMEQCAQVCNLGLSTNALPCEFINIVPEVLEDSNHSVAVDRFRQMLECERELTVPIIESLGNLRIPPNMVGALRETVLGILESAPFSDLPVAVRFLLESLDRGGDFSVKQIKSKVVSELRQKFLDICCSDIGIGTDISEDATKLTNIQCIIKTLHSSLISRDDVCKAYLENVESGNNACFCTIDFWLLVSLRGQSIYSKKATNILKKHVARTGMITPEFVKRAIQGFRAVLEYLFPLFQGLAGELISGENVGFSKAKMGILLSHRHVGKALYQTLFSEFSDPYFRQEVIVALVMHCGSADSKEGHFETQSALECLNELASNRDNILAMEPFAEFVKTLIHSSPQMQFSHARLVFSLLSRFVVYRSNPDEAAAAWFHLVLRKLLTMPCDSKRMVGAIGSVQFVKLQCLDDPTSSQSHDEWRNVFDLALSTCRVSPSALMVFCEELAIVFDSDDTGAFKECAGYANGLLMNELGTRFFECPPCEQSPVTEGLEGKAHSQEEWEALKKCFHGAIESDLYFGVPRKETEMSPISLNILPNLAKATEDPRVSQRFRYLCSLLRCVIASARNQVGNEEILRCPLLLFNLQVCDAFFEDHSFGDDDQAAARNTIIQTSLLLSLLYAINWIREVINSFSSMLIKLPALKEAILERFIHLRRFEAKFEHLSVHRGGAELLTLTLRTASAQNQIFQLPQKGKGSSSSSSSSSSPPAKGKKAADTLKEIRALYRPFRPTILNVLRTDNLAGHPVVARTVLTAMHSFLLLGFGKRNSNKNDSLVEQLNFPPPSPTKTLGLCEQVFSNLRDMLNKFYKDLSTTESCEEYGEEKLGCFYQTCLCILEIIRHQPGQNPCSSAKSKTLDLFTGLPGANETQRNVFEDIFNIFDEWLTIESEHFLPTMKIAVIDLLVELSKKYECSNEDNGENGGEQMKLERFNRNISDHCRSIAGEPGGKLSKQELGKVLGIFLRCSDKTNLGNISELTEDINFVAENPGQRGEKFESLTIKNLASFYESALKQLCVELDELDFEAHLPKEASKKSKRKSKKRKVLEDKEDEDEDEESLEKAEVGSISTAATKDSKSPTSAEHVFSKTSNIIGLFKHLSAITKHCNTKKNILVIAVKQGRIIVDKVLKLGMPFFNYYYTQHPMKVRKSLHVLQVATRQLQSICEHWKTNNDTAMMVHIPPLRRDLETLICAAKELLNRNNSSGLFTCSLLKKRNVDGTVITDERIAQESPIV